MGGTCQSGANGLVVSEVHTQYPTYFELFNGTSAPLGLAGYLLQWQGDAAANGSLTIPSVTINPGAFLVFVEGTSAPPGQVPLGVSANWVNEVAVILRDPNGLGVDFVPTGGSAIAPPVGTGWTGPNADNPSANADQSLLRNVFAPDTDTAADWALTSPSSPGQLCGVPTQCGAQCVDTSADRDNCGQCGYVCGASQICVAGACANARGHAWLSEYRLYGRSGVELHNPTGVTVTLTGYQVVVSGPTNLAYTMPAWSLGAGEFVFLRMGPGTDSATEHYMGSHTAFGPNVSIALFDASQTALDFVRFGTSTATPPPGVNWFGANIASPPFRLDRSAKRDLAKLDTDSAADWVTSSPSSPGATCMNTLTMCAGNCVNLDTHALYCGSCTNVCAAHESCIAANCSSAGRVVISELYLATSEGFEIFNGTDQTVDLSNWAVEFVPDVSGPASFTLPNGLGVAPGQFIGLETASGTSTATRIYMNLAMTWSSHIAMTLKNANGDAIDFVRVGPSVVTPPPGAGWAGANVANPTSSRSARRNVYVPDTDTAAEWTSNETRTREVNCTGTWATCAGGCFDLTRDRDNCGVCGNTCRASSVCLLGNCVDEGAVALEPNNSDGVARGGASIVYQGVWSAILYGTLSYDNTDATVTCRQLGFTSGTVVTSGTSCQGCQTVRNFQCTGEEARLADCPFGYYSSLEYSGPIVQCVP